MLLQPSRVTLARADGGLCGQSLPPDAPVWLTDLWNGRRTVRVVGVCTACAPDDPVRSVCWAPAQPCEGCDRPVSRQRLARPRVFLTCSDRCTWTARNRRASQRRAARRERSCAVCGITFTARRSDAQTCSNTCRQKRFRTARQARESGTSPPSGAGAGLWC